MQQYLLKRVPGNRFSQDRRENAAAAAPLFANVHLRHPHRDELAPVPLFPIESLFRHSRVYHCPPPPLPPLVNKVLPESHCGPLLGGF